VIRGLSADMLFTYIVEHLDFLRQHGVLQMGDDQLLGQGFFAHGQGHDLRVEEVVEDHVVQGDHQGAGVGHAGQAAAGGTQLVGDIGL